MLKLATSLARIQLPSRQPRRIPREAWKPPQSPLLSSKSTEWQTPWDFFRAWDATFNFDLDVCAKPHNTKCPEYFSPAQNGLLQPWVGRRCWCNPPYARGNAGVAAWVKKAAVETVQPNTLAVLLLPARTDTRWFHEFIFNVAAVWFVKGRIPFVDEFGKRPKNGATFPSMVCVWPPPGGQPGFRQLVWSRGRSS